MNLGNKIDAKEMNKLQRKGYTKGQITRFADKSGTNIGSSASNTLNKPGGYKSLVSMNLGNKIDKKEMNKLQRKGYTKGQITRFAEKSGTNIGSAATSILSNFGSKKNKRGGGGNTRVKDIEKEAGLIGIADTLPPPSRGGGGGGRGGGGGGGNGGGRGGRGGGSTSPNDNFYQDQPSYEPGQFFDDFKDHFDTYKPEVQQQAAGYQGGAGAGLTRFDPFGAMSRLQSINQNNFGKGKGQTGMFNQRSDFSGGGKLTM